MRVHRHPRRAATLVEAAVVYPVTFLLLIGLVVGAMGMLRYQEMATLSRDAARYALVRNSLETNLDIDVDLWTKATSDNPVFYVQYAHARVSSILRNAGDLGLAVRSLRRHGSARRTSRRARGPRGARVGPGRG